ncbi:uroporphyrinogen decarboxylase family protein [Kiritimatiella glycovorans]|uniref:Uroporphyrinogen decarboxylase n=1 Tax=Kiritimatiella glycovorans TaxID=1307763 RepID=A0A0G3EGK0_9BACT|nr:uroporphyrinogen decarboxylase family protein [Kiritimatiella glycovorans]AKJ63915.1 uroporphyrinogen decarboxylase [Kiritimatiella glycovorans]
MTDHQWELLCRIVAGEAVETPPVGFIIDSPWLPGWHGVSTLSYYASDRAWLEANLNAVESFPEVMFIPGFWSEFGMCTEPSAFGAKCSWETDALPHAHRVITEAARAGEIAKPDVRRDGLLPFVIERLAGAQPAMREAGHEIRFAVSRGPLNIASFLMGTTEFLLALYTEREACEALLKTITDFVVDWIGYQKERFDTIDAVLVLDDIVGFVGEEDYLQFAHPYLERIFQSFPFSVKAFHNDAKGLVCAPHLSGAGINLFNFAFEHGLDEMRALCGEEVTLWGNLPPRDTLAAQSPDEVRAAAADMVRGCTDPRRVLFSCGGGMPPDVRSEQLRAFVEGCRQEG